MPSTGVETHRVCCKNNIVRRRGSLGGNSDQCSCGLLGDFFNHPMFGVHYLMQHAPCLSPLQERGQGWLPYQATLINFAGVYEST